MQRLPPLVVGCNHRREARNSRCPRLEAVRFTAQWEQDASLRLRTGDTSALDARQCLCRSLPDARGDIAQRGERPFALYSRASPARRITFRDVDVEQIGYIYEGLLGYSCAPVDELTLGLIGKEGEEPGTETIDS